MNNIIVGMGEALWDVLPEGKKIGGAPANFAYHVSQFGFDSRVVSAVGRDELGDEILKVFKEKNLKTQIEQVDYPTGTVQVTLDGEGVPCYEIKEGVAWDNIPFTDELKRLALNTRAVCFGSLAQRSAASHATVVRFLDGVIRRERPTLRVFDVNLRQDFFSREVLEESMARCNILKISDEEAPRVAGCLTGCPAADPGGLCRELLDRRENLEMVILTEGAEGSRVFTRNRISAYVIPRGERVRPVDTVGAGDSFTAAFCAMLAAGYDIWPAQAFASKVAAFVCSCAGATPEYPAAAKTEFSGNL